MVSCGEYRVPGQNDTSEAAHGEDRYLLTCSVHQSIRSICLDD